MICSSLHFTRFFRDFNRKANWACCPPQSDRLCLDYLSPVLPSQFSQQSLHLVCTGAGPLLAPPPPPPSTTILFFSCFLQAVAPLFASRLSVNLSFPLLPRIYFAAFLLQLCHSRGFPLLHSSSLSSLSPLLSWLLEPGPLFFFLLSSAGATWTHPPGQAGERAGKRVWWPCCWRSRSTPLPPTTDHCGTSDGQERLVFVWLFLCFWDTMRSQFLHPFHVWVDPNLRHCRWQHECEEGKARVGDPLAEDLLHPGSLEER